MDKTTFRSAPDHSIWQRTAALLGAAPLFVLATSARAEGMLSASLPEPAQSRPAETLAPDLVWHHYLYPETRAKDSERPAARDPVLQSQPPRRLERITDLGTGGYYFLPSPEGNVLTMRVLYPNGKRGLIERTRSGDKLLVRLEPGLNRVEIQVQEGEPNTKPVLKTLRYLLHWNGT